jgi:hypothetical protein
VAVTRRPNSVDAQAHALEAIQDRINVMPTTLQRAYEIARSGECTSLDELVQQLKTEQFEGVDVHIASASVRRELRQLSQSARRHETRG